MFLHPYLDAMGIQLWQLKSKSYANYVLVSDESCVMSDAAQSLLHAMLASIDLNNKQILTSEALKKQITTLRPRLLFILGSRAAHQLFHCDIPIEELLDKTHTFENITTFVIHHPVYLLQNPKKKRKTYEILYKAYYNILDPIRK